MEWLVVGPGGALAQRWLEAIEDADERWRCRIIFPGEALPRCDEVILLPGCGRVQLPFPPPYVFGAHPLADGMCSLREAAGLPGILRQWRQAGHIPLGAALLLASYTCQAREALQRLGMPAKLRAWDFLPDMLALCTVHPPLTEALTSSLYPLIARRHGMNPTRVERSLRLAIESTWDRAPLEGLEACFGQSVDPERGKPTNREFLQRMSSMLQK